MTSIFDVLCFGVVLISLIRKRNTNMHLPHHIPSLEWKKPGGGRQVTRSEETRYSAKSGKTDAHISDAGVRKNLSIRLGEDIEGYESDL